jgi:hypothetical protein
MTDTKDHTVKLRQEVALLRGLLSRFTHVSPPALFDEIKKALAPNSSLSAEHYEEQPLAIANPMEVAGMMSRAANYLREKYSPSDHQWETADSLDKMALPFYDIGLKSSPAQPVATQANAGPQQGDYPHDRAIKAMPLPTYDAAPTTLEAPQDHIPDAETMVDGERERFTAWSQVFHRNAKSYTARDFDHGLVAWCAALQSQPASKGDAKQPMTKEWCMKMAKLEEEHEIAHESTSKPQLSSEEIAEENYSDRYSVIRNGISFEVRAGSGAHPVYATKFGRRDAELVAISLLTAFNDGRFIGRSESKDSDRLDYIEALTKSDFVGNGIVIWTGSKTIDGIKSKRWWITDLGDEDGSNLGDEISESETDLRKAIDAAIAASATTKGGVH